MISVIMPVRRARTAPLAIQSVLDAGISKGDQLVAMFDGESHPKWWKSDVRPILDEMAGRGVQVVDDCTGGPYGDIGGTPRNMGQERAKPGNWVMYMDDDDAYTPGALETVRRWVKAVPDRNHMFQMQYTDGRILWMHKRIYEGNVGTPMMALQPDIHHAGHWDGHRCQDYRYCLMVVRAWARLRGKSEMDAFFWHEHVICKVRPWE